MATRCGTPFVPIVAIVAVRLRSINSAISSSSITICDRWFVPTGGLLSGPAGDHTDRASVRSKHYSLGVRRHGWGGDMPVDDAAATARILGAARALLREQPHSAPTISEVAERLSVTRQTVYRYFPSSHALLLASVSDGVGDFLDDIAEHLRHVSSPADAVVEGIAYTYEQMSERTDLSLLLAASGASAHEVTSETSLALGRSILERLPVDWAASGCDDVELDGLVEMMLRTVQSFVVDPGSPPRSPDELRTYLRRWIGPAVAAAVPTG
jgi:AcrR family transcriptional regulator